MHDVEIIEKGWGREIIFANDIRQSYCGKIMEFDRRGAETSLHFHIRKHETFYVLDGRFEIITHDRATGEKRTIGLDEGRALKIMPGMTHKIVCKTGMGRIVEVSSHDSPDDSYRVEPGDSQRA